jgi:hypothetical protein
MYFEKFPSSSIEEEGWWDGVVVCKRMLFILRTQLSQTNNQPAGKPRLITCY